MQGYSPMTIHSALFLSRLRIGKQRYLVSLLLVEYLLFYGQLYNYLLGPFETTKYPRSNQAQQPHLSSN